MAIEIKENSVVVNYHNVIYVITKEEYNDLRDGWLRFEDMFD